MAARKQVREELTEKEPSGPRQLMASAPRRATHQSPCPGCPGGRPAPSSFLSDQEPLHGGITLGKATRWEARLRFGPSALGFQL